MSRVGKQTIVIPDKVPVGLEAERVVVLGPKGELARVWPRALELTVAAGAAKVDLKNENQMDELRALWGTSAAHLKNMIKGVTVGFEKRLLIEGIGYKAAVTTETVTLNVGFSHPVVWPIPRGLKVVLDKNLLTISGADCELVGQFAATLRAVRPPDPYKEKGLRYIDERVIRKQGKKAATTA